MTSLEERVKHMELLKQDVKFQEHLHHCRNVECFSYEELAAACFGAFQTEQHLKEHVHILKLRIHQLEQQLASRNTSATTSTVN